MGLVILCLFVWGIDFSFCGKLKFSEFKFDQPKISQKKKSPKNKICELKQMFRTEIYLFL